MAPSSIIVLWVNNGARTTRPLWRQSLATPRQLSIGHLRRTTIELVFPRDIKVSNALDTWPNDGLPSPPLHLRNFKSLDLGWVRLLCPLIVDSTVLEFRSANR